MEIMDVMSKEIVVGGFELAEREEALVGHGRLEIRNWDVLKLILVLLQF